MNGASIPTLKVEGAPSPLVKDEVDGDSPSPYMEEDDMFEDAGDLDFTNAQQKLWLSHIPRSLWEAWSTLEADDEIEIGTVRIEGSELQPSRISLKLHENIPQFQSYPKEYNLLPATQDTSTAKRRGQAFVFSEKDLPGHKPRVFAWDELDEDGMPGQGRSFLYERNKRERARKERKGKFEPYAKRPIPKQTAIAGIVARDLDCIPVKNDEYYVLESKHTENRLKIPERPQTTFGASVNQRPAYLTMAERAKITKAAQLKKQAAKDSRSARLTRDVLIDNLLKLFKEHRIWGLRDLKARVQQPEAYLREVLQDIAFMWKSGDFNGKWELKNEYKERDAEFMNPTAGEVAPEAEESDLERSGMDDDDDEKMTFEDV